MTDEKRGDIYFRTDRFGDWIIRFYRSLPQDSLRFTLGDQLVRSGTSIGAQASEAKRARSRAEFRSKLAGSLQEAEETLYWLRRFATADLGSVNARDALKTEADEIVSMLVSILKTMDEKN